MLIELSAKHLFTKHLFTNQRYLAGILLAATLCALVGPVSAVAQTAPGVQIYPLLNDTDVSGPVETA